MENISTNETGFFTKGHRLQPGAALASALVGLLFLPACTPQDLVAPEAPRPVRTLVAGATNSSTTSAYSGEVRARYENSHSFRTSGKVLARLVEVGSHVKAGQVLMRLDTAQETLQITTSDADVEASRSRIAKLQLDITRTDALLARKFASQAELDSLKLALDEAQAGLKMALARQQINVNQRGFSELRAERAGIVTAISAEAGQVVGAGQPVLTVAADGEREVVVSVPESRVDELRQAKDMQVSVWALPGKRYKAVLRELAPDTDTVTRTYSARVAITNSDAALRLGMTAVVNLVDTETSSAIRLPLTAVYNKTGDALVWVLNSKTAQVSARKVVLGGAQNDTVWIKEGLSSGETVVTAGANLLVEGQKVLVTGAKP
jgi:multidrug efflux system membrane fusion protein